MGKKKARPRRSFTPEFKAEIVELCRRGDRSVGEIVKDFDLAETAVRDWATRLRLARALTDRSHGNYRGWGDVVVFAAATAARIGEVSGVRACDIETENLIWTVRRQTTPAPGGLTDKNTKGKRARQVPLIEGIRVLAASPNPGARLFTGPRGRRISTAVLRGATHWDEVVTSLGHEHLRRHDLTAPLTLAVQRAPARRRQTPWSPTGPQETPKGGTGFLRYRLRPAKNTSRDDRI
ncbi:hypothetical protein [Streptomyces sp. NPDC059092]|uniref:hypothetical protein n=1 Tax=Streptomyces sp. NPDC059092 TaxID=3346725 RepID=UPI0036A3C29E